MPLKNDLMKKINKLFLSRISLGHYLSIENNLSDSISEQIDNDLAVGFIPQNQNSLEDFVLSRLGHIGANPSNDEKSKMLTEVYKYYSDTVANFMEHEEDLNNFPNLNNKAAQQFVTKLKEASWRERDLYLNKQTGWRNIYFLYGERGSGKTFFINHLISLFNSPLEKDKVLWIRINLGDDFGGVDPDLIHWLRSKITLVIFRYYYNKKPGFEQIIINLEKYIRENIQAEFQKDYFENLLKLKEVFCEGKGSETLVSSLVNEALARALLDDVVRMGYSFIFVLDGFDKIDIVPRYKQKFTNIRKRLNQLINTDTRLCGSYLIATRTETIKYLWEDINSLHASYPSGKMINNFTMALKSINFAPIVESRIDYLKKAVPAVARKKGLAVDVQWESQMDEFKNYLYNMSAKTSFSEFVIVSSIFRTFIR